MSEVSNRPSSSEAAVCPRCGKTASVTVGRYVATGHEKRLLTCEEVEGPQLIAGHEWEDNGALLNDWREVCRTVIEYGKTEKRCALELGHEGPHVWGPERPK